MKNVFQTGPCRFAIESDIEIQWEPDFRKFIVSEDSAFCDAYTIQGVPELPPVQGERILSRPDVAVYLHEGEEVRYYRLDGEPWFFAMRRGYQVLYWEPCRNLLTNNRLLFSLLGLEQLILKEGCILLHSSFIEYYGAAILFTGPSGVGKSTQADLWSQHRGARVINGDRALLCRTDRGWEAWGWPFSGSSPFCENAHAPIRAIVRLSQETESNIITLELGEALRTLFSQVTINRWNWECLDTALLLIQDLCTSVPMWHLGCRKDETAVQCLEKALG